MKYKALILFNFLFGYSISQSNNKCELDGKLFFNNAEKYFGDCFEGKANGWGEIKLNNGNYFSGIFVNNIIQNQYVEVKDVKNTSLVIGPNNGGKLNGPCVAIDKNLNVSYSNYDNGSYVGNTIDYFKLAPPELSEQSFWSIDGYGAKFGTQVPDTKNILYISEREYNNNGDKKYWLTLTNIEQNKLVFNFGSLSAPVLIGSNTKPEGPYLLGFSNDNQLAFFDIRGNINLPTKIAKCNLKTGTYEVLSSIPNNILQKLNFEKKLNEFDLPNSSVRKEHYILNDSSYITIIDKNTDLDFKSMGFYSSGSHKPENCNSLLVLRDKKHKILSTRQFNNIYINDFSVNEGNGQIAVSCNSTDSVFISIIQLYDFNNEQNVISFPGKSKEVLFSKSGLNLLVYDGSSLVILNGKKIKFGASGFLYGLNDAENTILLNDNGVICAYDIERKRLIYNFKLKSSDDYNNTGCFKLNNDFVIISGRVNEYNGFTPITNGIGITKFKSPEPIVNLIDFKRNEIEITVNDKNETIVKNIIAKNSSSDIIKNEPHSSNNQLPDSDSNKWKEDIRTALKNQKVNFIANSSKKKCYWCSNNVNCVKKTDAQMKDEIIRSKWSTQFLLMGILSGDDREEKSKNPMVLSFINSPIEIELYDCPKFCSRKCEYESYRAGY